MCLGKKCMRKMNTPQKNSIIIVLETNDNTFPNRVFSLLERRRLWRRVRILPQVSFYNHPNPKENIPQNR